MFKIKKEEYVNKTFRLKKSLVEQLEKIAFDNSVSLNELISQCCKYSIDNMEIKNNDDKTK